VRRSPVSVSLGESPLTDPRSVGSSAVFHVLVLILASLTALNVALPMTASHSKALYGEIDPVDNRADVPSSPGQGGGGPGDIGGMSNLPLIPPADGTKAQGVARDPGLGHWRRWRRRGRIRGWCWPRHWTWYPVLRSARPCPFVCLRHRLLGQHGFAQLSGGR
jgi:hypothetical protein